MRKVCREVLKNQPRQLFPLRIKFFKPGVQCRMLFTGSQALLRIIKEARPVHLCFELSNFLLNRGDLLLNRLLLLLPCLFFLFTAFLFFTIFKAVFLILGGQITNAGYCCCSLYPSNGRLADTPHLSVFLAIAMRKRTE